MMSPWTLMCAGGEPSRAVQTCAARLRGRSLETDVANSEPTRGMATIVILALFSITAWGLAADGAGGQAALGASSGPEKPPASIRVDFASPPLLSCGDIPFRPAALNRPRGYERRNNPAARALSSFLRKNADDIGQPRTGWFLRARTKNYIEFSAGRLPELGAMDFERRDGRWRWVGSGGCEPRAYRKGRANTVTWRRAAPARELAPATTEIPVLVQEDSCASGRDASGRVVAPWVHYGKRAVTVTYFIRPLSSVLTCQGVPPTKATLQLEQPLDGRRLRDGGPYPARPR